MPFFLYNKPEIAKQLLKYRYLHLKEAKEKATKTAITGRFFHGKVRSLATKKRLNLQQLTFELEHVKK